MFHGSFLVSSLRAREPKDRPQEKETQTLTSCQMLPVTVTGSAFDRKIVSVLPVPFLGHYLSYLVVGSYLRFLVFLIARARDRTPKKGTPRLGDRDQEVLVTVTCDPSNQVYGNMYLVIP